MKKPDEYTMTIDSVTHDPDHNLDGQIVDLTHRVEIKKIVLVNKPDFDDLQERADQLATQIQGMILCLEKHGCNINPAFLIDHYKDVLKEYRGEK